MILYMATYTVRYYYVRILLGSYFTVYILMMVEQPLSNVLFPKSPDDGQSLEGCGNVGVDWTTCCVHVSEHKGLTTSDKNMIPITMPIASNVHVSKHIKYL